ncbi:metaxin [Raphidocelis subcapitata]|uniref:Metaxin n=1 Tax=Raphidocelis subcapitata TaxID=307507 RepID=A0A2V0NZ41_9CHLO|nr:metaxin [Raphidocelis subcapitata]|eukprot:GBF92589.1 metaxin [Raphidocelis subcapitata]
MSSAAGGPSAGPRPQEQQEQQQQQQSPPILYQWPASGSLPTLTAAGLQAEAYLRFCGAEFCVERCASAGASPTGILPGLELSTDLAGAAAPTDLAAARAILSHLRKAGADLDAWLSPAQRAEVAAFSLLVEARLEPATLWTAWLERRGFNEMRKAAYGSLPFPLNWVLPWSQQREMRRQLARVDGAEAYSDACDALGSLGDRLRASPGRFFFGDRASSLDALLFGHAAFYLMSPIAAPVLRSKVQSQPVLARFVESVLSREFAFEAPPPPASDDAGGWSSEAQGRSEPRRPPTVEERRMWRGSQYWLAGAAAAVGAYVVFSGHYIDLSVIEVDGGDEEEADLQRSMEEAEEDGDGGGEE